MYVRTVHIRSIYSIEYIVEQHNLFYEAMLTTDI